MLLLVNFVFLCLVKFALDIASQILFLRSFPLFAEVFHRVQSKVNFFLCEGTILSHGIQTHHKLLSLFLERAGLDVRPLARVVNVFCLVGFALFLPFSFLLFVLPFQLLLLALFLPHRQIVCNAFV